MSIIKVNRGFVRLTSSRQVKFQDFPRDLLCHRAVPDGLGGFSHEIQKEGGDINQVARTADGRLVASVKMKKAARHVAVANLCFNVFGVLLFLPFLERFAVTVVELAGEPGMAAAWAQLIFNLAMVFAVRLLLRIFGRRLESFDASASRAAATEA